MTTMTPTKAPGQVVPTTGFELAYTGPGRNGEDSDKFWRVMCAGSTQIIHHGRRGTKGLVHVKRFGSEAAARTDSLDLASKKGRQTGYEITRHAVMFDLPADVVAKAGSSQKAKNLPGTDESYSRTAVGVFLDVSSLVGV